jgi:DNA-binding transcriptional MerR regulator
VKEISIGEFARRSRLSLKALRPYDERGVLAPARVDQASGYRYYDTPQLEEARLVVILRQLQWPLAAVKEVLGCDPAERADLRHDPFHRPCTAIAARLGAEFAEFPGGHLAPMELPAPFAAGLRDVFGRL